MRYTITRCLALSLALQAPVLFASEKPAQPSASENKSELKTTFENGPLYGHSEHGEAFDEGPRQAAYLMKGMPLISFPASTKNREAQKFVTQGVGQLHGFWYFEAERSFRQALVYDPNCAIAYWGMAMANVKNDRRAAAFIRNADEIKVFASKREQMYIASLLKFYSYVETPPPKDRPLSENAKKEEAKKRGERNKATEKDRRRQLVRDLEEIAGDYPNDVEARAFLAFQIWDNNAALPMSSHMAVDTVIDQVFTQDANHPAHHYRIHLWDNEKPERALESAARCGQTSPGIAHMWHMPGHTFAKLKRYEDAAWQQEASNRVDHAYMMRDKVLPDQIHNYAHNAEWLSRTFMQIGAANRALDVAKNMLSMPHHPRYNMPDKENCTSSFGRTRLFESLYRYEMWEDVVALNGSALLASEQPQEKGHWLHLLALAYDGMNDTDKFASTRAALQKWKDDEAASKDKIGQEAEEKARKAFDDEQALKPGKFSNPDPEHKKEPTEKELADMKAQEEKEQKQLEKDKKERIDKARKTATESLDRRIKSYDKWLQELDARQLLRDGKKEDALALLGKCDLPRERLIRAKMECGNTKDAVDTAKKYCEDHEKEVLPLALYADALHRDAQDDAAREQFRKLRDLSESLDIERRPFARLKDVAGAEGFTGEWRSVPDYRKDSGIRPKLEKLGPFLWSPPLAPLLSLKDSNGKTISLTQYLGKPVIVIFYLGSGCGHCIEQLNRFGPKSDMFEKAGISILAVSTDTVANLGLTASQVNFGGKPFPILADPEQRAFRAWRAHDDFENKPLHGTFLIDAQGYLRWWDTGAAPFRDVDFIVEECKRGT